MRYRHRKRGSTYQTLGDGLVQAAGAIYEGDRVVVYVGDDGQMWIRPFGEFHDGRFEEVPETVGHMVSCPPPIKED